MSKSKSHDGLPPGPPIIPDEVLSELVERRSRQARRLAGFLASGQWERPAFTRPLLGEVLHQSTELEELLDAYGARNNRKWRPFRSTIAAAKLFADVHYVLLHIQHSLPAYRLLAVEGDFPAATEGAITFTGEVLLGIARRLVEQSRQLGMTFPEGGDCVELFQEGLPPGRLAHDRTARKETDAAETVTYLATAFLNQAAESDMLHVPSRVGPDKYAECIPGAVSEGKLRHLQHQFHSLQSTYDTFVADTDTERRNNDLPVLRGHLSVIFHLLETATAFAHYYERHVMAVAQDEDEPPPLADRTRLLDVLMRYSLVYASRYLVAARELCHEMLRRYAEIGRVEVPGPRYRGFHVRPATLVAKVVRHYGSDVQMEMDGARFDAASPLDTFRVNEKINRQKRTWLMMQVCGLTCLRDPDFVSDLAQAVRRVVFALAEQGKVVIYQRTIPVQPPGEEDRNKTPMQYILDEVSRLQATGVIDMEMDLRVAFLGDKRVLRDLELLAQCGYGEDSFGNNVPLPDALSYLRR